MAGILTLLIFPYALWSWSFQMSYSCMFGIALFYMPIEKLFKKIIKKSYLNFLVRGLSMYTCVTIMTLPFVIRMFGVFPTYGLFANILFLPILTLAFCVSVFAVVTWMGHVLLYPVDLLLTGLHSVMSSMSGWWGSQIHLSNGGMWWLAYFVAMICFSRFLFVRPLYKYSVAGLLIGVYLIGFLV